jgi:hypothetical protein
MGLARALPELEESLTEDSAAWELLTDRDYKRLVAKWQAAFRPLVESRSRRLTGVRALEAAGQSFRKPSCSSAVSRSLRSPASEAGALWRIGR